MKKSSKGLIIFLLLLALVVGCSKSKSREFKSEKLGFLLSFPESWEDKYFIEENDTSLSVYFKPKEKLDHTGGLFFTIIKKTDDLNEEMYDSIYDVERYFEANGVTYFIGGPTDLNFPENHPELNVFLDMKSKIPEIDFSVNEKNGKAGK